MLGFATIDISAGDNTLTVWLTSAEGAHAGHTNAVIFKLGDDTAPRRALDMIRDRYVVLTGRTPREHSLLIGWGVEPADLAMLARETSAAQAAIRAAFEEHRAERGKADLIEPPCPCAGAFRPGRIGGRHASAVDSRRRGPGDADLGGLAHD